ncbi:helix-turn-helix transcriptional regulator [Rouxiella badensis]|jgi:AraC-like DNA-binding protein|uniref:Arabinose operon regulatory protein n=1 Tax=Rouxiella badensis TaxID=1646377 RepID=A0A1X0WBT6_9GAMM|nr:helix-turn-helix transcriptional regulator [Rouxiella badensis]MCC3717620.1 helix-turn-helix transcriptional regulator [Rouxiella badensis]MCC3727436.1 helix-turn-helix transcriptional regulator [Rouxiella badensis]MCC3732618.1 helix-turn-helix transcriptional regulator [Rouxiella badensis]MCC3740268.1 helix-turn-helix transcriptional regulator [Rouxiella badensis]MCC3745884.1 helix-turn-helix transcriptional regulator [Rouxiella badensis]
MHENFLAENQSLAAVAVDYQHGDCEPSHRHGCSQLIHAVTGVVQVSTHHGVWMVPPGRGVWLPANVTHSLRFIGAVQARTLFVDSLARADLPAQCQVVQISPLLRELILASFSVPVDYAPGGRDERIIELILDELRLLPILPLHLPEPTDPQLLTLCQQIRDDLSAAWELEEIANRLAISGRTLSRRFQRETGLRFSDWVRRAKILSAMNALALGQSVLDVALELGYDSPSAFSAMFRRTLGVPPSEYFNPAARAAETVG